RRYSLFRFAEGDGGASQTMASGATRPAARLRPAPYTPAVSAGRPASPIRTGVPTAPKGTAALSPMRGSTAARRGGNPREARRGATSAAGAPKPAAPSKNPQNNQASRSASSAGLRSVEAASARRILSVV